MATLSITMALLMGLTGSLHCAGMCGPIIWVMPFQMLSGWKKALGLTLYHVSRISIYAAMAAVLFSFKSIFQPQWQQYISIGLGVVLLLVGLASFFPNRWNVVMPWTGFVKKRLSKFMGNPSLLSLSVTGMLNGLLPCGLVYMALSMSVMADTVFAAVTLMYAFGIGTAPMLVALTILKDRTRLMQQIQFRKFVPIVMLFFGSLFVLRGMDLGIPYLSPKVVVEQETIKAECCH